MTRAGIVLSILAGSAALAYGLAVQKLIVHGAAVFLLGVAWLVLHLRGKARYSGAALVFFGLISVGIIWAGGTHWLALAGLLFSLLAWDLTAFEIRLKHISNREDAARMERAHFARFGQVVGLGVMGVFAAGIISVDLTLGSALLFAILGIWGISALVYRLRSRE